MEYLPKLWNIYQHLPHKCHSFVGKYTSTMEHMGMDFKGNLWLKPWV